MTTCGWIKVVNQLTHRVIWESNNNWISIKWAEANIFWCNFIAITLIVFELIFNLCCMYIYTFILPLCNYQLPCFIYPKPYIQLMSISLNLIAHLKVYHVSFCVTRHEFARTRLLSSFESEQNKKRSAKIGKISFASDSSI